MRKTQKGFTLVELIVVITILAILGTIAFISLQGYSRDARNSKVISDIRTLVTAVEVGVTDGSFRLDQIVTADIPSASLAPIGLATGTFGSGIQLDGSGSGSASVWSIDFTTLRQAGDDFRDSEGNAYVAAYAASPEDARNTFYQIAGQVVTGAGTYEAVVRGNYVQVISGVDANGLIQGAGFTNGVRNGDVMNAGTNGLYQ